MARHVVTPDDHGPILQVVSWFMMVVMILATWLKLTIRLTTSHVAGIDDAIVTISMFTNIGGVIAISLSVNHGLGKRIENLDELQISQLQRGVYASTIFYLLSLFLAKLSTLIFITRMATPEKYAKAIRASLALLVVWWVSSTLAAAFQCGVPAPWAYYNMEAKCFNTMAFWIVTTAIDMATDIVLILFPAWIVRDLQMKRFLKVLVVTVFASRIIVIIASALRLVYLRNMDNSSDRTFDGIPYHTATQCHAMLSTVVACVPAFKPFMDRANTGFVSISFKHHAAGGTYDMGNTYALQELSGSRNSRKGQGAKEQRSKDNTLNSTGSAQLSNKSSFRPDEFNQRTNIFAGKHSPNPNKPVHEDQGSANSVGSDKMIIHHTKGWAVQVDDGDRSSRELSL
ncbi:hypothetical protein FQN57_007342 [Myotisia sp. PD_48]|nr:hypothetical protein FQN57_007342 [Myotisia sp. PD_48]